MYQLFLKIKSASGMSYATRPTCYVSIKGNQHQKSTFTQTANIIITNLFETTVHNLRA